MGSASSALVSIMACAAPQDPDDEPEGAKKQQQSASKVSGSTSMLGMLTDAMNRSAEANDESDDEGDPFDVTVDKGAKKKKQPLSPRTHRKDPYASDAGDNRSSDFVKSPAQVRSSRDDFVSPPTEYPDDRGARLPPVPSPTRLRMTPPQSPIKEEEQSPKKVEEAVPMAFIKEEDEKLEACETLFLDEFVVMLKKGFLVKKHGRQGRPQDRLVWLSDDGSEILWDSAKSAMRRVVSRESSKSAAAPNARRGASVSGVLVGEVLDVRRTFPFSAPGKAPPDAERCLSLVTAARSLNLELPDNEVRELCADGFMLLVSRNPRSRFR